MKRRALLSGLAAAVIVAAGGAAWNFRLFGPHYPPTPYDDLLNQITDREPASLFGKAVLTTMAGMSAPHLAQALRGQGTLAARAMDDPAKGRVTEVSGWIVPKSVASYAALAASV